MISVLGIPYDGASSYLRGCAAGPVAIRNAFQCESGNTFAENGVDILAQKQIQDAGDLKLPPDSEPRQDIENSVSELLDGGCRVLSLGGDHSISFPILIAHSKKFGPVNLLQFDAHPDLYDELDGNRFSHACPFARAHEDGLIAKHVQMGIRTMNSHQQEQADRFGVEVITMSQWESGRLPEFDGPLYLTLDLDVLDPAFAPGISHYEPGGASVRQVVSLIQDLRFPIIGADIVELNPSRDLHDQSARVAAKFMKEILAKMLESPHQSESND